MVIPQVGSRGRVAGELLEQRNSHPEDKKQTLLALLILVLYLGMGMTGRSWDASERIQECNYPQTSVASQGLNSQAGKPSEEPMSVLRRWLADNVSVLLERLEHEVLELEQLVRELEGWLDALLGEPQPKLPCSTLRDCV
ncbi:small integral membrane protein 23 [Suncus etruscus]|uniref:small integral membrane protein 23 n=1 Tax=Suncus etruscus TaxID=109475 RepID=UPI0021102096|nr:small integral membrane protein 23 [Suncus etruscus]